MAAAFPSARVARLDRDVADGTRAEAIIESMRAGEIDILVGTQMVTKGHDLPRVTLVGVLNADSALSLPDFRAAERGFQLLVQVAGRAGRRERPGRVLIQTRTPEHPAIQFAARHDVRGFLAHELVDRREVSYPPFSRLALLRVDALDEHLARDAAGKLAALARTSKEALGAKGGGAGPLGGADRAAARAVPLPGDAAGGGAGPAARRAGRGAGGARPDRSAGAGGGGRGPGGDALTEEVSVKDPRAGLPHSAASRPPAPARPG